ncbi:DUF4149 domain-containing protein [Niveibacterium microcysteis]|uniref:DUF4149 domain-containing protein n=1 Tax=Niveibacterium microcysteis TaxID=2811415 RepID=A0ABX7M0T5_9RHOO|nr:DUF4149 domain-containing protein [Niveibacterium microcysteis]QSI75382.1 DUF4149 domain-containing protein [Niveibacterium microcysteis]
MNQIGRPLYFLALTLWVGALWTIGGIVAPTLFSALQDRSIAGAIAGRLFSIAAWLGVGSACFLIIFQIIDAGGQAFKRASLWVVVLMLVLTLASLFGIQPLLAQLKAEAMPREVMESLVRDRFAAWHGVSSILYLIQCALGGALVVLETASGRR